ncbi:MAG: hypothetical protein NVS1B13_11030 [Flavisolibacter sp.]
MKILILSVLLVWVIPGIAQFEPTKNVFIITTDGFRWQEVFKGADSLLISNPRYVKDTSLAKKLFWDSDLTVRRRKLLPFFWNVIAAEGQLLGNRDYDNKVNVKNIYKISYPGYNELLTGYADLKPLLNFPIYNENTTILEYLNNQNEFKGKVAAFSSWNVFHFILNSKRNGMVMNNGYQRLDESGGEQPKIINKIQDDITEKGHTRHDQLTYEAAKEYIIKNHPRVVLVSLGETDEYAHQGRYDLYLQKANSIDKMVADLWYYVQTDEFYRNNTSIILTTDHGRGASTDKWYAHNFFTKGSGEIWLGLLGSNIEAMGELKTSGQLFQRQIASTISLLLGTDFFPSRGPIKGCPLPLTKPPLVVLNNASSSTDVQILISKPVR